MSKTKKILIGIILITVVLLGIGYAAIQNVTLNITGTATANPSQSNFIVKFTGTPEVSDSSKVTAAITDDTNATINVEGLTSSGETVTAKYTVQNASTDLSADLTVETTNSNEEYFVISSELAKTSIVAGEATTLTVTVELIKTPISTEETSTIGIQMTVVPVQPGDEGTTNGGAGQGGTNEPTEPTLAAVTNDNIGEYIDLGNNIVGTEATTDDWRIYYVDENAVYVILADYLPNSTGYATQAGLTTSNTYNVSATDSDTMYNCLTTTSNWSGLTNGINGATAMGATKLDVAIYSYSEKSGRSVADIYANINDDTIVELDSSIEDYDLYVPHTDIIDECSGAWVSYLHEGTQMSYVMYDGVGRCRVQSNVFFGLRPIVALPLTTEATKEGDVWKVALPTLADVTNNNIGEYIDLGNNIIGTDATTDDWRIFYVNGDTVYAILSDYLPNSTGYAENAGLNTSGTYNVYSDKDIDTFLTGLTTNQNWVGLANGIEGATVIASPTAELAAYSYSESTGTNVEEILELIDNPEAEVFVIDSASKNHNLYVPRTSEIDNCTGIWLSTKHNVTGAHIYCIQYNGRCPSWTHSYVGLGVRPVVALPTSTLATKEGEIWKIK